MAFDPVSAVIGLGDTLIKRIWPDPKQQSEAQHKLLELAQSGELADMANKSGIIRAEAQSQHAITATWRPITMLVFVFIIANNYILAPYAQALFGVEGLALDLPPDMWALLKIGLGGYVVGRSVEKGIGTWKGNA